MRLRRTPAARWALSVAIAALLLLSCAARVRADDDEDNKGSDNGDDDREINWYKSSDVDQNFWRRDPTNAVAEDLAIARPQDDSDDSGSKDSNEGDDDEEDVDLSKTEIRFQKLDIFSDEELPEERIRVNPGRLRNFCKVNIQGAVSGDTNATTRFGIATAFVTCDGRDKVRIKIHPSLGLFVKDWTGVRVVKNDLDQPAGALVTFVGPQEVAIYNSTVLFLRDVDPDLAFIKLESGINATMTRMNFFDNTGGAVPVLIEGSAVLMGSVGFVRNYNPKWAGGIWAKNGAEVTASRCAWDNNGSPEAMPFAGTMYVEDGSQFILWGGGMTNNFGELSGAILVGNESSIIIEGAHLANNTGMSPSSVDVSGAIWIRNSNASINGTGIDGNKANLGQGAVRVTGQSYARVSYSQIQDNFSDDDGAAIAVSNVAGDGGAFAGEMRLEGEATLRMLHMGVIGNYGGGVRCAAGGKLTIEDTTLRDNVDGFGESYNLDNKDCTEFERKDLAMRNTVWDPEKKRIAEATFASTQSAGSFAPGVLTTPSLEAEAPITALEDTVDVPFQLIEPAEREETVDDMFALAQQLGNSHTPGAAGFKQFEQLVSENPF